MEDKKIIAEIDRTASFQLYAIAEILQEVPDLEDDSLQHLIDLVLSAILELWAHSAWDDLECIFDYLLTGDDVDRCRKCKDWIRQLAKPNRNDFPDWYNFKKTIIELCKDLKLETRESFHFGQFRTAKNRDSFTFWILFDN